MPLTIDEARQRLHEAKVRIRKSADAYFASPHFSKGYKDKWSEIMSQALKTPEQMIADRREGGVVQHDPS